MGKKSNIKNGQYPSSSLFKLLVVDVFLLKTDIFSRDITTWIFLMKMSEEEEKKNLQGNTFKSEEYEYYPIKIFNIKKKIIIW